MRRRFFPRPATIVLGVVALLGGSEATADAAGHVNVFVGQKWLDTEEWSPASQQAAADEQRELGAVMSFGRPDWPIAIAVDLLSSAKEVDVVGAWPTPSRFTGATREIALGVRRNWRMGRVHPYVGGGLAMIAASGELKNAGATLIDESHTTLGFWTGFGMFWRLGRRFNLGFDLRYSYADADLDFRLDSVGRTVKTGGLHAGITTGFGWPRESPSALDSRRDGPARDHDGQRRGVRHVHLFVGHKSLSSEWAPQDGQDEFGIVTTTGRATWPVAIAADAFYSEETSITSWASEFGGHWDQVQTYEVALGVRRIWSTGTVRLGLGGGLAWIRGSDDHFVRGADAEIGPWVGTSWYFHLRGLDIGAQLRWSRAIVEFPAFGSSPGLKTDAGGVGMGITLGYGW